MILTHTCSIQYYTTLYLVAQIGFTESVYSVMEGESDSFQVCITITNGVSLDSSHAYGNFIIGIDNTSATATGHLKP